MVEAAGEVHIQGEIEVALSISGLSNDIPLMTKKSSNEARTKMDSGVSEVRLLMKNSLLAHSSIV